MLQAHAVGGCMHFGHSNIATDWWAFSWWNWSQKEPTMRFTRTADLQDSNLTTQRLEAFNDGVFAIAITLLILDIRLPEPVDGAQKTLAAALLAPEFVRHLTWQYGLSNMLYVTAVIASWINPIAGLVIDAGLAFLYLLPSKPPVYRDQPVS
jgi:hypothetical protein